MRNWMLVCSLTWPLQNISLHTSSLGLFFKICFVHARCAVYSLSESKQAITVKPSCRVHPSAFAIINKYREPGPPAVKHVHATRGAATLRKRYFPSRVFVCAWCCKQSFSILLKCNATFSKHNHPTQGGQNPTIYISHFSY